MNNDLFCYVAAAALGVACLLSPAKGQAARNHNLNVNFNGNVEHCSDLKVTSRDGQIAQVNEAFTMTKAEAPILEMSGMDRGVFQVRGWDRAEYSVEACKIAVAEDRATAEQTVRGISVTHGAGRFSSSGPSNSDANWQVYFIVRAPKDGNLDLETKNGPISIAGVNGTIKVRALNGPVSLHDSAGTVDVHTTNGPISFGGNGGEVHLTAQNGPISLELTGDTWNGSQLDARTTNGPVSVSVPETFHSGLRVETSGHAPVSCSLEACRGAWSDNGPNQRVMQLNGSQDTVRVSTSNGPVSVHTPRKNAKII